MIQEGCIVYKVTPISKESWVSGLAPKEMKLFFKKGKMATKMQSMGGIFQMSIKIDAEKKTIIQQIKVWNDKMYCLEGEDGIEKEFSNNGYKLNETEKFRTIAGLECKSFLLENKLSKDTFSVWCTDELAVDFNEFFGFSNSKFNFPLDFRFKKFGLEFRLEAKEILNVVTSEDEFKVAKDYIKVSADSMANYFSKIKS